jgi:hypothetical protein
MPDVDPQQQPLAERMFPAPIDHGLAADDRAVSTVQAGTDTPPDQANQDRWYQGGGRIGEKAVQSIVIYPPTRGSRLRAIRSSR